MNNSNLILRKNNALLQRRKREDPPLLAPASNHPIKVVISHLNCWRRINALLLLICGPLDALSINFII